MIDSILTPDRSSYWWYDGGGYALIAVLSLALLVYRTSVIIHDVYLGPLSRFAGPKLWAATRLPLMWTLFVGNEGETKHALHAKYGPCVRISPTDLSYCDGQAWKDIYGHKTAAGKRNIPKDYAFYSGGSPQGVPPSVLYADDTTHGRQRRILSHSFSDQVLKEQEPLLSQWGHLLVAKLDECASNQTTAVDILAYFNFTTFDIMSDLTFSAPLGMLKEAKYNAWLKGMYGAVKNASRMGVIVRIPGMSAVIDLLFGSFIRRMKFENYTYSAERVDKRIANGLSHPDLWTQVLKHAGKDGEPKMSLGEMHNNGSLFMIAGTETTATLLSGLTYHLLRNPSTMAQLTSEVRTAFPSASDITLDSSRRLPFMNACIEEGLRIYPPVPAGLPRTTPEGGAEICGEWVPPGVTVSVSQYSAYRSTANFHRASEFLPERWLASTSSSTSSSSSSFSPIANDDHAAFQPFSTGPRNCIGKNLAYHEMRLLLALVLWHFDLELDGKSDDWGKQKVYIIWEKRPLWVKIARVER